MSVKENLIKIKSSLPSSVTLVAVSKTKPNQLILQAYDAGHRDFGENYVQELVDKYEQLPKDINWHFIGHLQSNKVKYIAPFVYLIHGIDSFKLLQEVNKQALKNNRIISCLLQVHIAQEETKFGLLFEEAEEILNSVKLKDLKNILIKGFMCMASNTNNTKQITKEFRFFKNFQSIQNNADQYTILSFGMSNDYKIAMEQGSTLIRVGSGIFGDRNYSI